MQSSYLLLCEFANGPAQAIANTADGAVYLSEDGYPKLVLMNYGDYQAMLQLARLPNRRHDELMVSLSDEPAAT